MVSELSVGFMDKNTSYGIISDTNLAFTRSHWISWDLTDNVIEVTDNVIEVTDYVTNVTIISW